MESLAEIALRVAQCSDCSLHLSRTKPVPGEGDNSAEIMLIGEGPGAKEDQEGAPGWADGVADPGPAQR